MNINFIFQIIESPIFLLLLGVIVLFLIFTGVVFLLRTVTRNLVKKPEAFHRKMILIKVPKNEPKEQQSDNPSFRRESVYQSISVAETIYTTLGGLKPQRGWEAFWYGRNDHLTFEIVADEEQMISFFATCPAYLKKLLEQQIQAQYEDSVIEEVDDFNIFNPQGAVVASRLKLSNEEFFPINTYDKLESDPLSALTNALSKFEKGEGAAIQYVIRSAPKRWQYAPARIATVMQQGKKYSQAKKEVVGSGITKFWLYFRRVFLNRARKYDQGLDIKTDREYRLSPMEEETVKSLEDKVSHAGFETNIRVIASAGTKEIAEFKCNNIVNAFAQYSGHEYGNSFEANNPSADKELINDFIYRNFHEKGDYILNAKELTSLYHMPLPTTETPNIRWLMAKKAAPPFNMPKEGVILGEVDYRGKTTQVRILRPDRQRHVYVIGRSGSGKSVLLSNMAIQDIQNGEGVGIIDPHGDLIEDVLPHIPKERADDVVIFNPSDIERPVGLNMMEYDSNEQKDFAVQEMIAIFYKLFGEEMIGPMFEHYMRNAMLALMEDKDTGATIIEVPRMFTDEKFRADKVKNVTNPIVKNFWQQEYEQSQSGQQAADMLSYVISKIGRFLTNDMMRNIVGQDKSGFNFKDIMDNQKICLVNLCKGTVGEVNSSLLGLIMVSKLQMAAMSRATMAKEKRKDFYLYIDEFQNYTTDSIATILSEARKYKLDLILAHQYVSQLVNKDDTKIRDAVFGNAGTIISFRIGVEDAETLAKEFAPIFNENDVINVEKFTANIKLLIENTASRPFNMKTIMPPPGDLKIAENLKQLSRLKFGRDRAIVEAEIAERGQLDRLGGGADLTGPESFI
ncbi:type IV secretory system conjugative DNA transfer family protein [Patescibacteria group bacterium]|nr:type IV secretory system conjugative DNA transfer family protein [Patescibacteria group bacterium]MBU1673924.1 type IV secretory system conjugative DNA transfer family protein [Patescibacteria group bacterium]MBU1963918.1 type IV secretory system conjugative DNA transfer family protein [Patescibacteria group bacterium]